MPNVITTEQVHIETGAVLMEGDLHLPGQPSGLVLFVQGSGGRHVSSRNRAVAKALEEAGFGTLLLDLLTQAEEASDARAAEDRFTIDRLGERAIATIDWLGSRDDLRRRPLVLLGASTDAAAAMIAAAARPAVTAAVVSHGGRPDLAPEALGNVQAPSLFIVGGEDAAVIEANREAMRHMSAPVALEIIAGASHRFEEPGALDNVTGLAADWCRRHASAPRG